MLHATVKWGKEPGIKLRPHKFSNEKSKAEEFKGGDWEWVNKEDDLSRFLKRGWSIRMSNTDSSIIGRRAS
jgi:hypothetical protein